MSTTAAEQKPIRTLVPARLDRLHWSPFHTRMVLGLGGAWILDGLQITIASSVTGELTKPATLGMTSEDEPREGPQEAPTTDRPMAPLPADPAQYDSDRARIAR